MAHIAAHLNEEIILIVLIWCWQCSVRYKPHLPSYLLGVPFLFVCCFITTLMLCYAQLTFISGCFITACCLRVCYVMSCHRPDMTFTVDWALKPMIYLCDGMPCDVTFKTRFHYFALSLRHFTWFTKSWSNCVYQGCQFDPTFVYISPLLFFCLVLLLFVSYPVLLLAHSPDFCFSLNLHFPKGRLFCVALVLVWESG